MRTNLQFKTKLSLLIVALSCSLWAVGCQAEAVLTQMAGQKIPFSSLKGKWVMINYWASWCQPCLDEIAELNAFYKKNKAKVALFAVNFDGASLEEQLYLVQRYDIQYPSLAKNPGRQLGLGEIQGVPATFIFNPEGRLQKRLYGGQTQASLNKALKNLG